MLCALAFVPIGVAGCSRSSGRDEGLVIATPWDEPRRAELLDEFGRWMAAKHEPEPTPKGGWIRWVTIPPNSDLAFLEKSYPRLFSPGTGRVDVVIGVDNRHLSALEGKGWLFLDEESGHSPWFIVRRLPVGLAVLAPGSLSAKVGRKAAEKPSATTASDRRRLAFDDPRHDALALAWAKQALQETTWADGYARLVRDAGEACRVGRRSGSALAAVLQGEAQSTPATGESIANAGKAVRLEPPQGSGPGTYGESGAIIEGTSRLRLARFFREFLREKDEANRFVSTDEDADDLLCDLLGATLVDAQDELWDAWNMLERSGHPKRPSMWMSLAPPWPPASITKLSEKDPSGSLVQTLAAEIAPDPDIRAWLLRDWLGPPRLIDEHVLAQIATAVDGRLFREPRFRAWLRAEWTAWARQRYRRVARMAKEWTES
ncbi:hypothetical protein [Singulisphaera sp. PoT]|uniref:hypothetical protein n=1 Tax=Singulisphaera sp. PoT TaxID=3411797 RepID=UPI003BF46A56